MTNAAEKERWNAQTGQTWARFQVELDRHVGPIGARTQEALLARLGAGGSRRVLDIGCGAGDSTVRIARALGAGGEVTGVDISSPMLEVARKRQVPEGAAGVSFIEADAQTFAFEPESFDGLYSRFGVMFFEDPVAAFANLNQAGRKGAPLAFCCWRPLAENPWFTLPLEAASFVPRPPPEDPNAPGPFAFADPDRVRSILAAAGWTSIETAPLDVEIGGSDLDVTAAMLTRIGPLGAALRISEADDATKARAEAAVREAFAPYLRGEGVYTSSATWLVTARAGR
jgi:SAM-dependent methyltransferase